MNCIISGHQKPQTTKVILVTVVKTLAQTFIFFNVIYIAHMSEYVFALTHVLAYKEIIDGGVRRRRKEDIIIKTIFFQLV